MWCAFNRRHTGLPPQQGIQVSFKTQLQDDAQTVFLNSNEFAESVWYLKGGCQLSAGRCIRAVVNRQQPEATISIENRSIRPVFGVLVANHATSGIASSEVDTGKDVLMLAERIGQADKTFAVVGIRQQDDGLVELEVS